MSTGQLRRGRRSEMWWLAGAIVLLVAAALFSAPSVVSAQSGITGDVCVDHYQKNSVCTANDVVIAKLVPYNTTDACTFVDDETTLQFLAQLQSNATERYDIGMFIGLDGQSAQTGNMCYHDYLNPIALSGETPDVTSGVGPYWNLEPGDADTCGDVRSADPINKYLMQTLTLACADANADGVVDPVSTCLSWDNNEDGKSECTSAAQAIPGTKSKCRCEPVPPDPPIIVYSGYDFGDLPSPPFKTLLAEDGARHSVQKDTNADGNPDTTSGVPAVWLGAAIDLETNGLPATYATGDDLNGKVPSDEDGVEQLSPRWLMGTNGGHISVTVSTSLGTCPDCQLAFWFDWNGDGTLDNTTERTVYTVTAGVNFIDFDIPLTWTSSDLFARFRLYDSAAAAYLPTGLVLNGEVEDYYLYTTPLAVSIESFSATAEAEHILVSWQTVSELENAGFNLYRSTAASGVRIRLNDALIPARGGTAGSVYTWEDRALVAGVTYVYWLEDVDVHGLATMRETAVATWHPRGGRIFYLPLFFGR